MSGPIIDDPRLAEVYDPLDPDRSDLDVYVALVGELGAQSVLDVGCGTGTFACMLAQRSIDVTAVDPSGPSLDVARTKPGADAVRWLLGDATNLPPLEVDVAFMTANVAQVFLTDEAWSATLAGIARALRPQGWLVFETAIRPPGMGGVDTGAHPRRSRRARGRRGGVVGGGRRRVRAARHLPIHDEVPARRCDDRDHVHPAVPRNAPTWRRRSCAVASMWSRYVTLPTGQVASSCSSPAAAPPDAAVPRPGDTTS